MSETKTTYPVPLDLAREYMDTLRAMQDNHEALRTEFKARAKEELEPYQAKMIDVWRRMASVVGINPDTTFQDNRYVLESRFIEDGFAAIVFQVEQMDSLQAMLMAADGEENREEEAADPETVPEGTLIN